MQSITEAQELVRKAMREILEQPHTYYTDTVLTQLATINKSLTECKQHMEPPMIMNNVEYQSYLAKRREVVTGVHGEYSGLKYD